MSLNFNCTFYLHIHTSLSLILNFFAFVNLIEKYKKAVLFLNISLCLFIVLTGAAILRESLAHGLSMRYNSSKFLLLFLVILIIVNKYKVKNDRPENEIEEIGQHNE